MRQEFSTLRRLVLRRGAMALAAVVTSSTLPWTRSEASETLPKLSEDDPTAQQLKYVHDALSVSDDLRGESDYCYNCRYYNGEQSTAWAACDLFPGKAVNAIGWCSVWSAKS